ncbi:MAG: SDR family NAD(P)-dependent oxidoreductase, partial [bacterium]
MLRETIFNLQGRVALVTGGSKGLGKAMARILAEAGADIVISSRNPLELQAALDEILRGTDSRGHYCVADQAQRSQTVAL